MDSKRSAHACSTQVNELPSDVKISASEARAFPFPFLPTDVRTPVAVLVRWRVWASLYRCCCWATSARLVAFGQRNNPNWTSVYPSYSGLFLLARDGPLASSSERERRACPRLGKTTPELPQSTLIRATGFPAHRVLTHLARSRIWSNFIGEDECNATTRCRWPFSCRKTSRRQPRRPSAVQRDEPPLAPASRAQRCSNAHADGSCRKFLVARAPWACWREVQP